MNPQLPADLFTSCLTTPIKTALKWFTLQKTSCLVPNVTYDLIERYFNFLVFVYDLQIFIRFRYSFMKFILTKQHTRTIWIKQLRKTTKQT